MDPGDELFVRPPNKCKTERWTCRRTARQPHGEDGGGFGGSPLSRENDRVVHDRRVTWQQIGEGNPPIAIVVVAEHELLRVLGFVRR